MKIAIRSKKHQGTIQASRYRFEDYISMLILLLLVAVVSLQIVSRYIFQRPLLWTEEVARYLLVILTFIGSAIAVRNSSNISLDFILDGMPKGIRSALVTIALLLELTFYAAGTFLSIQMALFSKGRYLVSVHIPRTLVFALIAFGFVLMSLRAFTRCIRQFSGKILPREVE